MSPRPAPEGSLTFLVDELSRDWLPDPLDQLWHDLKTSLTTIHDHAQLLARGVRRSTSPAAEERMRMRDAQTTMEATVRAMATVIDGLSGKSGNGRGGSG